MSLYAGAFVGAVDAEKLRVLSATFYDDSGTPLWGPGFTPKVEIRLRGSDTIIATVIGSWPGAAADGALFLIPTTGALAPAAGVTAPVYYEFVYVILSGSIVLSRFGADGGSTPGTFAIQSWP